MLYEDCEDLGYDDLLPDLKKITSSGTHLLSLINNILDLSKQNFTIYKPGQYKLVNCDIKNSSKLYSTNNSIVFFIVICSIYDK